MSPHLCKVRITDDNINSSYVCPLPLWRLDHVTCQGTAGEKCQFKVRKSAKWCFPYKNTDRHWDWKYNCGAFRHRVAKPQHANLKNTIKFSIHIHDPKFCTRELIFRSAGCHEDLTFLIPTGWKHLMPMMLWPFLWHYFREKVNISSTVATARL